MPTLYWGPWLAKIRRGGPAYCKYDSAVTVDNKLFRLAIIYLLSDTTLKILNIPFIHFFT